MLRFIALSGTISVTENLYLYEAEGKMMIVDCGVGFPDLEMHGVDLVIPDFSYIIENKEKLAGVVVSQGHEDHIGALPFLLRDVETQIWAAPLVTEFLKDKFEDYKLKDPKINTFNPDGDEFKIGPFTVHPFRVTHSVPDSCGFAIDTPEGRIFHVPEHKMDPNPVSGKGFDLERAKQLASGQKNLFLASDCIGANKPGFSDGELQIEDRFLKIVEKAQGAVFMTAISSNISRFQQILNVAGRTGRKVVFVGWSIQKKTESAYKLGILKYPSDLVVGFKDADKYSGRQLIYVVAGCYGQVGSSLYRLALGEHDRVAVEAGDTMIFSADPAPPYSKESEDFVIDQLTDKGLDVHYYELNEGLYSGGHGRQEDIKALFDIVKPRYFIPVGGAIRYMKSYMDLAVGYGAKKEDVFRLKPGENVIFSPQGVEPGPKIPTREILVHGRGIGDIGKVVLGDRAVLGNEGVVVAVFQIDRNKKLVGTPKIVSRGFVFEKISKDLINEASVRLGKQIEKKGKTTKEIIHDVTLDYLANYLYQKTGRRPMILPVVVEV